MSTAAGGKAFLSALGMFAGNVHGRASDHSCDLSGNIPGRLTATDIIDQISADIGSPVPEEDKADVIFAYVEAFNKAFYALK